MFFNFKRKAKIKEKFVLIVEIESGSVACSLVSIKTSDQKSICPDIRHYVRKNFTVDHPENPNSRDFFSVLFETAKSAIEETFKATSKAIKPEAIYCFSSSPFYLSQTSSLVLEEEKPFRINHQLIGRTIRDHLPAITERLSLLHPGLADDHLEVVESKLMRIYVNGYDVPNPQNLKAKKLELVHFSSLGSSKVISRIDSILNDFYPQITPGWHSTAFALYDAIRLNPSAPASMIIVSIGGLNSEIIVIQDYLLSEIVSIPFGEESAVQTLCKKTNKTVSEVRSLFSLQQSLGLGTVNQESLANYFAQVKDEWQKNFTNGIDALSGRVFLPKNILVVGHGPLSEVIARWIKEQDLAKITNSQFTTSSAVLFSSNLEKRCTYMEGSTPLEDIHLVSEVIFCDTLIKQGESL